MVDRIVVDRELCLGTSALRLVVDGTVTDKAGT
jgi:hypothetical protein